jgi:hypothetical protein
VLEIRPKGVDVTRWNEVKGTLRGSEVEGRKRYKLSRVNRKPLVFGEAFEDLEGLADLVKQQIARG